MQQIDGILSTIEMQRETLEGANTNTAVLQTMKFAADALKSAHQHMLVINVTVLTYFTHFKGGNFFNLSFWFVNRDIDQVHDMMDDIAEQQDVAKEISDAISNPVAFPNDIDEVC